MRSQQEEVYVSVPKETSPDNIVTQDVSDIREKCLQMKAEIHIPVVESVQSNCVTISVHELIYYFIIVYHEVSLVA